MLRDDFTCTGTRYHNERELLELSSEGAKVDLDARPTWTSKDEAAGVVPGRKTSPTKSASCRRSGTTVDALDRERIKSASSVVEYPIGIALLGRDQPKATYPAW